MKRDAKGRAPSRSQESQEPSQSDHRVRLFPAWCKKCGNCVAFCPKQALEMDEWGYPRVSAPERCTACHLCEKLCPDFAITVLDSDPGEDKDLAATRSPRHRGFHEDRSHSPERLAPEPEDEEAASD